jgi:hypothetical protein
VHRPALLALDAVAVLAFAAIGRSSHEEGTAVLGVLVVAAPFLVGATVGGVLGRSWRAPLAWRSGLATWAGAVVVGLALRAVIYDRLPLSFAIVATVALGVLILGWRGVARLAARARADA